MHKPIAAKKPPKGNRACLDHRPALLSIIALLGTSLVLTAASTVDGVPGAITDYTIRAFSGLI